MFSRCKIQMLLYIKLLNHWGRVTHICASKLTIIGSDNGLSPGRRQAIIWTNVGILLIRTSATNFSEILGEIHSFSFLKMHLKMSSAKWRQFGLGLNELSKPWKVGSVTHCSHLEAGCPLATITMYEYMAKHNLLVDLPCQFRWLLPRQMFLKLNYRKLHHSKNNRLFWLSKDAIKI